MENITKGAGMSWKTTYGVVHIIPHHRRNSQTVTVPFWWLQRWCGTDTDVRQTDVTQTTDVRQINAHPPSPSPK